MKKPLILAMVIGAVAACAATHEEAQTLPAGGGESCDAAAYQYLIGQSEAQIDKTRLPKAHRIACHNCPVTMDFNPKRLTVTLDPAGKVATARCG